MLKKNQTRILVVVPAFNEEGNIKTTIEQIASLPGDITVLVVNDGSYDSTRQEVEGTRAELINLPFNLGVGGAVQMGFIYALTYQFDIVVQVDGDGQHDMAFFNELISPVVKDEVDMTIGSRFLPPHLGYRSSFIRRMGIHFFAYLISSITQYTVTDPTSGFRAFNRKMIRLFARYYPQDFPEPEAIAVASRYKARVKEVPVQMRKRMSGNSSIRYLKTLYYMIKVTFAIFLDKLKPLRALSPEQES